METMTADGSWPPKHSYSPAHCLHHKERSSGHQFKLSSPLFDPPYCSIDFDDCRERACRQNVLTNPVFSPASRTGSLDITTLNFLKNRTSVEVHLSRNSAGTIDNSLSVVLQQHWGFRWCWNLGYRECIFSLPFYQ